MLYPIEQVFRLSGRIEIQLALAVRGCFAKAWSVAEMLRVLSAIGGDYLREGFVLTPSSYLLK